eukprot:gene23243-30127_t
MSNIDADSAPIHLPLSDDVSKDVVSALRKLSGEIDDLSNNLFNAKIAGGEGGVSDGMPVGLLPEINIDSLLNISQPKVVDPEINVNEIEVAGPSQAAAVFDSSIINSTVATPSFDSAAMIQQYRNTEIMQTNSKDNIQKDGSREDYYTDDSSRIVDLHVRDMDDIIKILNSNSTETVSHEEFVSHISPSISPEQMLKSKSTADLFDHNRADDDSQGRSRAPSSTIRMRKIAQLLHDFEHRYDALSGSESAVIDEWENDDDTGYVVIPLSEEEFFEMEEEVANEEPQEAKQSAGEGNIHKKGKNPIGKATSTVASDEDDSGHDNDGDSYDPDGLAAEEELYDFDADGDSLAADLSEVENRLGHELSNALPSNKSLDSLPLSNAATAASSSNSNSTEDFENTATLESIVREKRFPTDATTSPANGTSKELPFQETTSTASSLPIPPEAVSKKIDPIDDTRTTIAAAEVIITDEDASGVFPPLPPFASSLPYEVPMKAHRAEKRQSVGDRRRSEIIGQQKFQGADGTHCFFNLKVIFEPYKTGFEETKDLQHPKGTIIAGRYEVADLLGQAAFSTALQCIDLAAEEDEAQWVCLKVIKNNKDFFDQSLDEIKLLQYINSRGDPDDHHVLRLIDFFYCKEHLFIVSELLKENLYEFGRFIKESDNDPYYTMPRLKRIMKQVLEALKFIHSLKLIHCDIKPENIVIRSFSRCEVKLIDFGSSCFTTDHLTTYIQSRSYRAPEVIIGHKYDSRIDIWSVGAVLAELHTGYVLFQNDSVPTMLSRISGIMGPYPPHVLLSGRDSGKYFTMNNIVYERDQDEGFQLILPKKTDLRSRLHLPPDSSPKLNPQERMNNNLFLDFVQKLLNLDPTKRLTAVEALRHPWLEDADRVEAAITSFGKNIRVLGEIDGPDEETWSWKEKIIP